MTNLNVKIVATAQTQQASAGIARLEAQTAQLNAQLAQTVGYTQKGINPKGFAAASAALAQNSMTFRQAAASSGLFQVAQMKLNSATEDYIKLLQKQKVGLTQFRKSRQLANAAFREQLALQNMFIRQVGTNVKGQGIFDTVFNPRVSQEMNTTRTRLAFLREELKSVAQQTVNWGKNTQWAGRQLMVGFTMPILAAGAATGVLAYNIDKELTRIQKVYDTTANQNNKTEMGQMAVARELADVRSSSLEMAKAAATSYGASVKDTLEVEADLAATGLKGADLRSATTEVVKNATLGEIDYQTALQATIAMQTTFRLNSQKTSEAWAYMNSVENATSLSMKDFAEAIPIAAGPIQRMGGDIRLLGEYLVAMKERGIGAAQGANAIKAIMQRIYRPSKQVREEWEKLTHTDLTAIVERNKGNIEGMMQDLASATKKLTSPQEIKALAGLFGTWQVTRLGAILEGVNDLADGVGQVTQAHKIGLQSAQQWANTQEYELEQMRKSLSGKFRIALESLKASLLETGNIFLKAGTKVLEVINKIVKGFNALPDGVKHWSALGAVFIGLIGPIVMLTGLFANLVGNLAKMGLTIAGLGNKFNLLTTEERAAMLATDLANSQFVKGSTAAQLLSRDIQALTQSYAMANAETAKITASMVRSNMGMAAGRGAAPLVLPPISSWQPIPAGATGGTQIAGIAQSADKADKSVGRMAAGMALFGAAAAASMISTNKTVDSLSNAAMIALMIGPAIGVAGSAMRNMVDRMKAINLANMQMNAGTTSWLRSFGQAPSVTGHVAQGIKGVGKSIVGLLGPMGLFIAAIGAGYLAWRKISSEADKAGDAVKKNYNNAKPLADIYGFTATEPGAIDHKEIKDRAAQSANEANRVRQVANEYSGLITKIKQAYGEHKNERAAFNEAFRGVGMQVLASGGTIAQAKQAVTDALTAAQGQATANRIVLRFEADMGDIKDIIRMASTSVGQGLDESISTSGDMGWAETIKKSFTNFNLFDVNPTDNMLSEESKENVKAAAKNLRALYDREFAATGDTETFAVTLQKQLSKIDEKIASSSGPDKDRYEKLRKELITSTGAAFGMNDVIDAQSDKFFENATAIEVMNKLLITYSQNTAKAAQPKNIGTPFQDANKVITGALKQAGLYNDKTKETQGAHLDEPWKQSMIAADKAARATANVGGEMDTLTEKMKNAKKAVPFSDIASAMHDAMTTTQDQIADIASDNFQNRMDSAMKAFQDAQDRRMDAMKNAQDRQSRRLEATQEQQQRRLENEQERASDALDAKWENRENRAERRWDAREKAISARYDNRIDGINKVIKAEQRAEQIRQRIFDAEIARIQRLADMANQRIDFQAALGAGNLDEAAKIRNQMEASQTDWMLSDANAAQGNRSEDKVDRLQARIDNLEKLKDARLEKFKEEREAFFDHLKKIEDREKKSLKRRQEAEARSLQLRQDREKRILQRRQERQQKFLQREIENNVAAQQEIWENRRDKLNRAIEDFRAYIPKNARDLQRHINNISRKYGVFRVDMRGKFNKTAVDVKQMLYRQIDLARREMVSKINWALSGAQITNKMLEGAFGIGRRAFFKWISTGVFPGKKAPLSEAELRKKFSQSQRTGLGAHRGGTAIDSISHSGGYLGANPPMNRGGMTGKKRKSELNVLAQKGEYVVQKNAVDRYGVGFFDKLNKGVLHGSDKNQENKRKVLGGAGLNFSGAMGLAMAASIKSAIAQGIMAGAVSALQSAVGNFGTAAAGKYGDLAFGPEQLKNASIIASVGKGLGMSGRDIEIGIMTAITESMLRNVRYGDRDSQGLFQQRPSQGWGSISQVTNPRYAAASFFKALKGVGNRGDMTPWMAAQSVQRSAFSDGSNYRQYWDEALAIYKAMRAGGTTGGFVMGRGGRHRPVNSGRPGGIHDAYTGYPAVDIPVPVGTNVYAVGDGMITRSYDIRGHEPRSNHGGLGYRSYGRVIYERLDSGPEVLFAHLSNRLVKAGTRVKGGSVIGKSGNTGHSYGPHLHFGARGASPYAFMKQGGFTLNTGLAELHPRETVLTAPLTQEFKQGVRNFAQGGGNTYNVDMHFNGDPGNRRELKRFIIDTFKHMDDGKPKSRKGTD